jgi:uncharacterized protein (DUF362 family)/Pyruvate/2-oxoacid:ferredoxin oxidoreductase delta subunit
LPALFEKGKHIMTSQVALIRCNSYDEQGVREAVARGLSLLGGMQAFIHPGEKIVLKPNVLVGEAPEKLVGPHPLVFKAVAGLAQTVTPNLSYGDSSAVGKPLGNLRRAGFAEIAQAMNISLADFENGREVHIKDSPFLKRFILANGVLDADGLISISKLKTHGLTRITGAIKNQFGCVPGMLKAEHHLGQPNALDFARMLVCLNLYIRARLYVMDGITAMQGNGPRGGTAKQMNVLLFSADPVALDATVCRMIDLDPAFVPTMQPAQDWGLGTCRAEEIEIVGDGLESFIQRDFDVVRAPVRPVTSSTTVSLARNLVSPRPVIDAKACKNCGTCVQHCPASPKAVDWHDGDKSKPPTYQYGRCIRCYCCQELCSEGAISVSTPLLGRLLQLR